MNLTKLGQKYIMDFVICKPTRIRIINLMRNVDNITVSEIQQRIELVTNKPITRQSLHKQLLFLRQIGLVEQQKQSQTNARYTLSRFGKNVFPKLKEVKQ